ncbi:hypothetical protein UPYG_G00299450 [Umbra pygmaea]|uniref:Ig-like domain-containing protein n=1 Tax=Umbra pygmaea TaxID=75934 RepID=A0ABD0W658_UMBPY
MMPDLVKISWKLKDKNGKTVEVPQGEKEELEQREEGKTIGMVIIDKKKTSNKYSCSVKHERGSQDYELPKEKLTEGPLNTLAPPTTPCIYGNGSQKVTNDSFHSTCSLNLASLAYTVMTVKSLVYCCGLTVLHRIMGIFGSGTILYVKETYLVEKPKVTAYPASKPEPNGKTTLLCLARDMMPDLVKISWKMKDQNGQTVEVPQGEKEELIQRDEGKTTSMIIIDKEKSYSNKYSCSVKHEKGIQAVEIPNDNPTKNILPTLAASTCPPRNVKEKPMTATDDYFRSVCSLNLASLAYTVMTVKSLVYCCGFVLLLRITGSRPQNLLVDSFK